MAISSCVTISLVHEAKGGPFVFWDDLAEACRSAAEVGFDAVEVFAPSADAVDPNTLRRLLDDHHLKLAAIGTGAGWLLRKLTLTHADIAVRTAAIDFVSSMIDFASPFGASVIIGSMQGRWGDGVERRVAISHLAMALEKLGEYAANHGVLLLYEPLNRYETNLVNTIFDGTTLLDALRTQNVRLLADLFHMNIEEANLPEAIRLAGDSIGHVHFVDSNRKPAGMGHLDIKAIGEALRFICYDGYLSAEALPFPDPLTAAKQTMATYRESFATSG